MIYDTCACCISEKADVLVPHMSPESEILIIRPLFSCRRQLWQTPVSVSPTGDSGLSELHPPDLLAPESGVKGILVPRLVAWCGLTRVLWHDRASVSSSSYFFLLFSKKMFLSFVLVMMIVCSMMNSAAQVAIPQLLKVHCFVSLQWSIGNYIVSWNTPWSRSRRPSNSSFCIRVERGFVRPLSWLLLL